MMKKNKDEGFSFFHFFGMAGNARLVLVFFAVAIFSIMGLSNFNLSSKIEKLSNTLSPLTSLEGSLIYIKSLDGFVDYPPYGEIYIHNYNTGTNRRLTFDHFYDSSPTYSKSLNTIFFESKRGGGEEYEMMSIQSDLYGYNVETGKISNFRELLAFSLEYDDSEILSPKISSYNDSLIAFFEKRFTEQNLIVCNYLSKNIMVRLPIKPNLRTNVDSFLEDFVSIYDASRTSEDSLGTFFISLDNQNKIYVPKVYGDEYFFTGQSKDNKYYVVSKQKEPKMIINFYSLPTGEVSLFKEINSSILEELIDDLAVEVVLKDETIIYYYSDHASEKLYSLVGGKLKLMISTKEEIVDFEFH